MATTLGEKIRNLRKQKGFKRGKLAKLSETSKSYIRGIENKNPPEPSMDKVAKIAAALGVTADDLVDSRDSTPVPNAVDQAFFRRYLTMDSTTKERIRLMIETFGGDKK